MKKFLAGGIVPALLLTTVMPASAGHRGFGRGVVVGAASVVLLDAFLHHARVYERPVVYGRPVVYVPAPPPQVIVVQPTPPPPSAHWMPGYWQSTPYSSTYDIWVPGHSNERGEWVEGHYERRTAQNSTQVWVEGHWEYR